MEIIYPNDAEKVWLEHLLNVATPADQVLRLYVNDVTPDESTLFSLLVEASGGGYIEKSITGVLWGVSSDIGGKARAIYANQLFTFTGPLASGATIYGWYLTKEGFDTILAVKRLDNPFTPVNNGDNLTIPLTLFMFSGI